MTDLHATLVGCGQFPRRTTGPFGPGYGIGLRSSRFRLEAAVDVDPRVASNFTEQFGGRPFQTLPQALSWMKPHLLIIASSDASHAENLIEALKHDNCPQLVIVEKPICSEASEMMNISQLAAERAVKIVVNHSRRFSPWYRNLRSRIQRGDFGEAIEVQATFYNGWLHNGVHVVDTVLFLFEDRIVMSRSDKPRDLYESSNVSRLRSGHMNAGKCPIIFSEFLSDAYQILEFDLRFEKVRLQIDDFSSSYRHQAVIRNTEGESVLRLTKSDLGRLADDSMAVLLQEAAMFVEDGISDGLDDADLNSSIATMSTIWSTDDWKVRD